MEKLCEKSTIFVYIAVNYLQQVQVLNFNLLAIVMTIYHNVLLITSLFTYHIRT